MQRHSNLPMGVLQDALPVQTPCRYESHNFLVLLSRPLLTLSSALTNHVVSIEYLNHFLPQEVGTAPIRLLHGVKKGKGGRIYRDGLLMPSNSAVSNPKRMRAGRITQRKSHCKPKVPKLRHSIVEAADQLQSLQLSQQ